MMLFVTDLFTPKTMFFLGWLVALMIVWAFTHGAKKLDSAD